MSLPQGIDFRATVGFVTDPANCYGETATTVNYPTTTPQGNNVGWEDAPGSNNRDRVAYTGNSAKVAGIYFVGVGTTLRYRIDLPAAGQYKVRAAAGDAGGANEVKIELFDNTTSLGILVNQHTTAGADQFYDATDVQRTSNTDWATNNVLAGPFTFASTICRFRLGNATIGTNYVWAHIWIEQVIAATPALQESGWYQTEPVTNPLTVSSW